MVVGPPGPEVPAYFAVTSTLNEVSHHGTQVCVLRDLYRWARSREARRPLPAAFGAAGGIRTHKSRRTAGFEPALYASSSTAATVVTNGSNPPWWASR